jgi:predicted transcriptional regulator
MDPKKVIEGSNLNAYTDIDMTNKRGKKREGIDLSTLTPKQLEKRKKMLARVRKGEKKRFVDKIFEKQQQKRDPYSKSKKIKGVPVDYKQPTVEEYAKMKRKERDIHRSYMTKDAINRLEHAIKGLDRPKKMKTLPAKEVKKSKKG